MFLRKERCDIMKIMADSVSRGTCAFVQVRDLKYLADTTKNRKRLIKDYYNGLIEHGLTLTDFVKVVDREVLAMIMAEEAIIDFDNYKDMHLFGLATEIIQRMSAMYDIGDKKVNRHIIESLKDIVAYRNGTLDYSIPVVPTGRMVFLSGNMAFSTTQYDGLYLFRATDGDDASKLEYREYLLECILSVYNLDFEGYTNEELDYTLSKNGNNLLVKVGPKKKKSKIKQFITKKNKC